MKLLLVTFVTVFAVTGYADHGNVNASLNEIGEAIHDVDDAKLSIKVSNRNRVIQRLQKHAHSIEHLIKAIKALPSGKWIQAYGQDCNTLCGYRRQRNVRSPEGALCVSGETRVTSATTGNIRYIYGTWGGIVNANAAASAGRFCYVPHQKRDNDRTDITVGCFCE